MNMYYIDNWYKQTKSVFFLLQHLACGISNQGSNPCPCSGSVDSEPLEHQGSATDVIF